MAMQGAYQCGLQWWQGEDLGQSIDVQYKLSEVVKNAFSSIGDYDAVNAALAGNISANSTDPLAKIIESGLTVEPYLSFIIADLLEGYDITETELQKFNLPNYLANKGSLVNMFTDYFDFSCTR